jgi:hypothetical protein
MRKKEAEEGKAGPRGGKKKSKKKGKRKDRHLVTTKSGRGDRGQRPKRGQDAGRKEHKDTGNRRTAARDNCMPGKHIPQRTCVGCGGSG